MGAFSVLHAIPKSTPGYKSIRGKWLDHWKRRPGTNGPDDEELVRTEACEVPFDPLVHNPMILRK